MNLLADAFAADARVAQAKGLLLAAMKEHQSRLAAPRPADPSLKISYEQLIAQFGQQRGGELFYPYLGSGIGNGALVELADGSVKYDMIGGIGVHHLGHGHPALVSAGIDAALADTVMQGNLQQNTIAARFTQNLLDAAAAKGAQLKHCFLTSSGAMANENALKLAFQKKSPAHRILAFEKAFAGRTLALSQITDRPQYRAGLPSTIAVDYIPFFDPVRPQESISHTLRLLKQHLSRHPKQHAAMWLELVLGEGGYYAGAREFFVPILQELKSAGVAVVVDEVQTFGRTSEPFAFQHFGLDALVDIVTIGKMTQVCATLFSTDFKPQPGLLSQTFTASTSALFAGDAIVRELLEGGYFGADGRNMTVHRQFADRLAAIAKAHQGWIRGPYGLGAMIAFTPFDGSADKIKKLLRLLFDAGVIAFQTGSDPTRIRFLPPVGALRPEDVNAVCDLLGKTMELNH